MTAWTPGPLDRITAAQDYPGADEIVLSGVSIHLEDMGDWFHFTLHKPGTDLHLSVNIRPNKGGVVAVVEEIEGADGLPVDPDVFELT